MLGVAQGQLAAELHFIRIHKALKQAVCPRAHVDLSYSDKCNDLFAFFSLASFAQFVFWALSEG